MRELRIMVFSSTFGAGHVRAAEAVIEALKIREPGARFTHLDCGEFLSKTFNSIIKTTYISMIKYSPRLWGKFYYGTSRIQPDSIVQRFLNHMGQKDFERLVSSLKPDLIVCTYPTVAGALSDLKLQQRLQVPLVTVVTDFAVHSQWIHRGVDLYVVGSQEVAEGLVARGIDSRTVRVTGIPVHPVFEEPCNKSEIISRLGLDQRLPTVLVMGGAFGVLNSFSDLCKTFAWADYPVQSIVVCGRDEKLFESLDDIVQQAKNPMVRFGFVENVDELMSAADLIITKAGGLTVSEALTKKLPLLIFRPIPGQEEENAQFLNRIGAGKMAENIETLKEIARELLENPDGLMKMRENAGRAIPGRAAEKAAEYMLELVEDKTTNSKIG